MPLKGPNVNAGSIPNPVICNFDYVRVKAPVIKEDESETSIKGAPVANGADR